MSVRVRGQNTKICLYGMFVMSYLEVVSLGQVWCLIVSIPYLCPLSYLLTPTFYVAGSYLDTDCL